MIEKIKELDGEIIQSIQIKTDDDVDNPVYVGEYSAYDILIVTKNKKFHIVGCHDDGPWVEIEKE